jgi:hypothetical protein
MYVPRSMIDKSETYHPSDFAIYSNLKYACFAMLCRKLPIRRCGILLSASLVVYFSPVHQVYNSFFVSGFSFGAAYSSQLYSSTSEQKPYFGDKTLSSRNRLTLTPLTFPESLLGCTMPLES